MSLTYIVTGASRGIGLEFVSQIASNGHTVFALARNPNDSEGLQKLEDNKKVFVFQLDVTDENSIKNAVKKVSKLAPQGVDVLINNAGICGSTKETTASGAPKEIYLDVFATNVVAVANVTDAFLPLLRQRGQEKTKKIINMSSILASISQISYIHPPGDSTSYPVSKAALNMLTKVTASKLEKENFIVYASHPGWVKTDMSGKNALIEKKDSVTGMLKVIKNLTPEQNGSFIDFEGNELPW